MLKSCFKGSHKLIKIHEAGCDLETMVIRWCSICGSIVIDTDVDGRIYPGNVMKMKNPECLKQGSELMVSYKEFKNVTNR